LNMRDYPGSILKELRRMRGLDLSGYRRNVIEKRIIARIAELNMSLSDYHAYLRTSPAECDRLIDALLINVSSFFRDPLCYEVLAWNILPRIIEKKRKNRNREIRVWSAGCATGEEPYSIAILVAEIMAHEEPDWTPYVFATDISRKALAAARDGLYFQENLENVKLGIVEKYFTRRDDRYGIRDSIRKMVSFSSDDLASETRFAPSDSVFGTFDLILCRNVLIYFSPDLQKKVFRKLCMALDNGGYLVLGRAESPGPDCPVSLNRIDGFNRIFQKKE